MTSEAVDILTRERPRDGRPARGTRAHSPLRERPSARERPSLRRAIRPLTGAALTAIFAGNLAVIVWLWLHNGGISNVHSWGDAATSAGRITGLLGTYALFLQVILMIRLTPLEKLVGLDRLSAWHGTNGKLTLYLILAHVVLITAGYASMDRISFVSEFTTLLTNYDEMWKALIGTVLLVLVVVTSLVIVKRRLRYETWFLVHLMAYAGVVLTWSHQTINGNEFVMDARAGVYWTALYLGTLGLAVVFRLTWPLLTSLRFGLRVQQVIQESPDVYSIVIGGRRLDRLEVRAGQFFQWRFLTWGRFWEAHPFSLSAAPDGKTLRITVKGLGDFTKRIGEIKPGTRIIVEGPFGVFTDVARRTDRAVLIAGGIGITPIRALAEEMEGDVIVLYRTVRDDELVFRDELDHLVHERGIAVHYLVGDHASPEHRHLLTPGHLAEIVPDIARRDVYVCGPPTMMRITERSALEAGVPARCIHTEKFAF